MRLRRMERDVGIEPERHQLGRLGPHHSANPANLKEQLGAGRMKQRSSGCPNVIGRDGPGANPVPVPAPQVCCLRTPRDPPEETADLKGQRWRQTQAPSSRVSGRDSTETRSSDPHIAPQALTLGQSCVCRRDQLCMALKILAGAFFPHHTRRTSKSRQTPSRRRSTVRTRLSISLGLRSSSLAWSRRWA
jgi:hypothetical protein